MTEPNEGAYWVPRISWEMMKQQRDVLADRLIECEELRRDADGTLRWTGNGEPIIGIVE